MTSIIASVGRGRYGINAAHLTARRVVEFAFRCTREYFSALHSFSRDLRLRQLERSSVTRRSTRQSARRQESHQWLSDARQELSGNDLATPSSLSAAASNLKLHVFI